MDLRIQVNTRLAPNSFQETHWTVLSGSEHPIRHHTRGKLSISHPIRKQRSRTGDQVHSRYRRTVRWIHCYQDPHRDRASPTRARDPDLEADPRLRRQRVPRLAGAAGQANSSRRTAGRAGAGYRRIALAAGLGTHRCGCTRARPGGQFRACGPHSGGKPATSPQPDSSPLNSNSGNENCTNWISCASLGCCQNLRVPGFPGNDLPAHAGPLCLRLPLAHGRCTSAMVSTAY